MSTEPGHKFFSCFSVNDEDVLIQVEDNNLELWTPEILQFESAVSGNFSIISPKLSARDTIYLGQYIANKYIDIQIITAFYSIKTIIFATAFSPVFEVLENPFYLGEILLLDSKDTLLALMANIGKNPVGIKDISLIAPDTSQISLMGIVEGVVRLNPGDTLKQKTRFKIR